MSRKLRFALVALVLMGASSTMVACADSPTEVVSENGYDNNNASNGYDNNN